MLPVRNGIGPSCVGLPAGPWPSLLAFLVQRFPAISADTWVQRMARGDVVDEAGQAVAADDAYTPHTRLYYYRHLPDEPANPAQETVLYEDDWLVVADKPHFLPVTPGGKHLQQTLLVRLRQSLACPELAPLHRIDRETAGLVLLAKQPATRAAYEALFARHAVRKTYQAIAPWRPGLQFPITRRSHLAEAAHFMQMQERADAPRPNAETTIELVEIQGRLARYQLTPLTGKRHQLRVHMAALGLPLLGDRIYPTLLPEGTDDPANPLRLLAHRVAFDDPVTGEPREFVSRQALAFPSQLLSNR